MRLSLSPCKHCIIITSCSVCEVSPITFLPYRLKSWNTSASKATNCYKTKWVSLMYILMSQCNIRKMYTLTLKSVHIHLRLVVLHAPDESILFDCGWLGKNVVITLHKFLLVNGMPHNAYTFFVNWCIVLWDFLNENSLQCVQPPHFWYAYHVEQPQGKLFEFYWGQSEHGQTLESTPGPVATARPLLSTLKAQLYSHMWPDLENQSFGTFNDFAIAPYFFLDNLESSNFLFMLQMWRVTIAQAFDKCL